MSQIALSESKRGAERRGLALVGWPLIALVAAGLALRLFLSRAPLWNDEIWSILNLRSLNSPAGVLWGLSHDNNHFLNSLWLWGVTPFTADPTALRLVSILAGAATIPVMARLGARHGAGFVAAALTALSFFQIVYSVEARGYAVATLALVLTWSEIEAERPSRLRLALFSGLGFFAHLAFGPALAGLAFAAFLENIRKARGAASTAFAETFWLFWPPALACLPTLAFFVAGYVNKGGFTIGAFTPFSYGHAIGGVASLGMMTFGLDPTSFLQTIFALLGLPMLILAAIVFLAPRDRKAVYVVMLVLLPGLALALKIPNTHVARYFFAASPFLILLAAEILYRARPPWRRRARFGALRSCGGARRRCGGPDASRARRSRALDRRACRHPSVGRPFGRLKPRLQRRKKHRLGQCGSRRRPRPHSARAGLRGASGLVHIGDARRRRGRALAERRRPRLRPALPARSRL